ncbi:MAG: S1C family serine protease [Gaiellaceae bacterium]
MGHTKTFLLSLAAAAALIGAAGGAGVYALLSPDNSTTVVRQVTVDQTQPTSASTAPLSVASIYQLAYRGVVKVIVTTTASGLPFGGGDQSSQAQGSGFVLDSSGHVITNEHVVAGGGTIKVQFWDGSSYSAKVVGVDKSTDVAVLKVSAPASNLHPLSFADSGKVSVGDGVVAIGAPFGLQETVTSGIVSALHRQMTAPNNFTIDDSIQTDAAINHGNSGGPLLNTQGRVIGITSQIESDSGGSDGVGFAVPSNTVKSIAAAIVSTGKVEHAYLGVQIDTTPASGGVRLSTIRIGTPADNAGLKNGDIVTSINGVHVPNADALRAAIDAKHPGDTITITYLRGGSTHTAKVTLSNRPS